MQNKKYLSMLGLSRRAGKLAMGHDMVLEAIKKHKSELIIFTSDASQGLEKNISVSADRYLPAVACIRIDETADEIHFSLGYRAAVMSVNDKNFAKRIVELINQEVIEHGD